MSESVKHVPNADDWKRIKNWRRRGFYAEASLVKALQKNGFKAVRIPCSNPTLNPLPDLIARKGNHVFAFEVKNVNYYAYYERHQVKKLFEYLNQFVPTEQENKHPILVAHLGKRWIMKELKWGMFNNSEIPEQLRILKRDHGNFNFKKFNPEISISKNLTEEK